MNQPISLRCEYLTNPLGLDTPQPRLSWQMNDNRRGAKQTAYQVLAGSSLANLNADKGDLWDSGTVKTDQSIQVTYGGKPLASRQRVYWKVRIWDAQNEASPWSEAAWFETAFLDKADWKVKWIASPIVGGAYSIPPVPYLRKTFNVAKPVASARLYVTALGVYEFELNGQRVGDQRLSPGRTEYTRRVPYHTFDVTAMVNSGENVCGAILGDGWYCGHLHSDPRQTYGDRPRLLAQLEITFADGSRETIVSDSSWKAGHGPIRSSDMLMGEDYDARMEIPGWSRIGFDDSKWSPVVVMDDPKTNVVAHRAPPVRPINQIKPIAEPTLSANRRRYLFDMGQNMVGHVRLRIRGGLKPGQVIDIRYTEMLDKDGKPYTLALRSARATDHYTTSGGKSDEYFEPRFTFHGFRYVEIRDYPGTLTADDLVGVVIHSDTTPTGQFECSEPMLNQLQSNIVWSQKGNFIDIPTDCPQRDERLGWTGDAQVFIRTAAFNMDVANFFDKWVQDVEDAQGEDGRIPSVVPHVKSLHNEGGPAWADAAIICPWTVYLCYGDTRILEQRWTMMTRFMDFMEKTSPGYIRADENQKWRGYGDWLSINAETPKDLIGTAFFAHCSQLMSKIATILGKKADAKKYDKLFDDVRAAWIKRYVTPDGLVIGQTQTGYVLGLHFNLLPEDKRAGVFDALVRNIAQRNMHLSTGFVGTPYLNDVLTRNGRDDVAYALMHQKSYPSWLYPITQGATTTWERWDAWTHDKGFSDTGMNSFNHYAFGAVGAWMYATIAGVDLDPEQPAYKHSIIRPHPGGGLSFARAALITMYGKIESNWRVEGDTLHLNAIIPANTTATLRIPATDENSVTETNTPASKAQGLKFVKMDGDVAIFEAGAGSYSFASKLPARQSAKKSGDLVEAPLF